MPVFVDRRLGSHQYVDLLQNRGVTALLSTLAFGDVSFAGNGRRGKVKVGVEVKTVSDFEGSFESKRLISQLTGMRRTYEETLLLVTGDRSRIHPGHAMTFQFQGGIWMHHEPDEEAGADWLAALWRWWEKPWSRHSSLKGLELPRVGKGEELIPVDPSLTRMWSACLPGIGWELSGRMARQFGSPLELAQAPIADLARVAGVGPKRAAAIKNAILGLK